MDKRHLPLEVIEFLKASSTGTSAADETLSPPNLQRKRRRTLMPVICGGFVLLLIGVTGIFARWYVSTVVSLSHAADRASMQRAERYQKSAKTQQKAVGTEATKHESAVAKLRQQAADAEKEIRRVREAYEQLEKLVVKAASSLGPKSKDFRSAYANLALMLEEREKIQNKPVWPPPAFLLTGKVIRKDIDPKITMDVIVWVRRSNDGPYSFTGYCFLLDYEKHPVVRSIKGEITEGNKFSFNASDDDELLWPELTKKVETTIKTKLTTNLKINIDALTFTGKFGAADIEGKIII